MEQVVFIANGETVECLNALGDESVITEAELESFGLDAAWVSVIQDGGVIDVTDLDRFVRRGIIECVRENSMEPMTWEC